MSTITATLTDYQRKIITWADKTGEIAVAVRKPTALILEKLGLVTVTWWTPKEGWDPIVYAVTLTEAGWDVYREEERARHAREAAEQAARVLGTGMGEKVRDLIVVGRSYAKEAGARLDALLAVNPDPSREELNEALGAAVTATIVSTGTHVDTTGWCHCPVGSSAEWIHYERWSTRGLEAHGYCCPECRRLTQTG